MSEKFDVNDKRLMDEAVKLAFEAFQSGDVPVGAVVVKDGEIIGRGSNKKELKKDASAHAEMLALQEAAEYLGDWRLNSCVLYSTTEPCIMCAGAILHFRISEVVFGVMEPKFGGVLSNVNLFDLDTLNHRVKYRYGLESEIITKLMKNFFRKIRDS
ncbi:MAG: nucleoside deaminase [Flexistipes sinusarabici]|uniref:tRNA-specific adenosine deaminase n=1 Tax=Flexistipes sinusarabici TaxID=2352 RepID=A0A5D0MKH1_FLESI|nr:nucleoside deaminase [Flexistipes sinusarabici]TYB33486.1 MAG: nucleoside deaminase [Flexistipes sinusarabici]